MKNLLFSPSNVKHWNIVVAINDFCPLGACNELVRVMKDIDDGYRVAEERPIDSCRVKRSIIRDTLFIGLTLLFCFILGCMIGILINLAIIAVMSLTLFSGVLSVCLCVGTPVFVLGRYNKIVPLRYSKLVKPLIGKTAKAYKTVYDILKEKFCIRYDFVEDVQFPYQCVPEQEIL